MSVAHRRQHVGATERQGPLRSQFSAGSWGFVAESRDWSTIFRWIVGYCLFAMLLIPSPDAVVRLSFEAALLVVSLAAADAIIPHRIRFDAATRTLGKDRWLFGSRETVLPIGAKGRLEGRWLHILDSDGTSLEKFQVDAYVAGRVAASWIMQSLAGTDVIAPPPKPSGRQTRSSFGALIFGVLLLIGTIIASEVSLPLAPEWKIGLILFGLIAAALCFFEASKAGWAVLQSQDRPQVPVIPPPASHAYRCLVELLREGDVSAPITFSGDAPAGSVVRSPLLYGTLTASCLLMAGVMASVMASSPGNPASGVLPIMVGSLWWLFFPSEPFSMLRSGVRRGDEVISPGPLLDGESASKFELIEAYNPEEEFSSLLLQCSTLHGSRCLDVSKIV